MSLNKFTHIPLLKNDAQLKQKKWQITKKKEKKRNHPKLFKKIENGGRIEKILFSLFFLFDWEWKSGGKEKMSLNKFTHIPLLKNDAQLKQKSDK